MEADHLERVLPLGRAGRVCGAGADDEERRIVAASRPRPTSDRRGAGGRPRGDPDAAGATVPPVAGNVGAAVVA